VGFINDEGFDDEYEGGDGGDPGWSDIQVGITSLEGVLVGAGFKYGVHDCGGGGGGEDGQSRNISGEDLLSFVVGVKRGGVERCWGSTCSPSFLTSAFSLASSGAVLLNSSWGWNPKPSSLSEGANVDIGIFKGMESGMLRGMFIKAKFKGIERGTFIKDTGKEEMDIGKGMLREDDISIGDLERGGSDEGQLEVVGDSGCASLGIASDNDVESSEIGIADWVSVDWGIVGGGGEGVVVESTGGDSFFIVLVTILEDEEEDDGSHGGTDLDLACPFDFGGFDDLDLVFLVNLRDLVLEKNRK
jgi:hypothetical protein